MRKFVIGDIHGAYKALEECLEKSNFNYEEDLLISLGDVCDGWPETAQCIDELLKIKNLILVLGNHDQWALEWMQNGKADHSWLSQGGRQTIESYKNKEVPKKHVELLENAELYYLDEKNRLFVHAGIDPDLPLDRQDPQTFLWDRNFFSKVKRMLDNEQNYSLTDFEEIYIGHSPIHRLGFHKPIKVGEVWLMDTGASWDGVLSMMDLDANEIFISSPPADIYPSGSGRL
ncbi:MAG: metallophosphoesterase [Candidatus Cyclobacteriaceae bacterium M2_1C_046]